MGSLHRMKTFAVCFSVFKFWLLCLILVMLTNSCYIVGFPLLFILGVPAHVRQRKLF